MNLFEKIFNYQLLTRLEDSGTFMVTSHERSWLKTMLAHPAASEAFTEETLAKLHRILESDQPMDVEEHLIQKAGSKEKHVYHPLLRPLRRMIANRTAMRIRCRLKGGQVPPDQWGLPYKLEYSMVKREWYVLWYRMRHRSLMSTPLRNILQLEEESVEADAVAGMLESITRRQAARQREAVIEVVPMYNEELSRILHAFSSFEKDVHYDAEQDTYRVHITHPGDEAEYLLSKIRFLGKRVRVINGDYLKRRMLEASTKALERYQQTSPEEELSS